MGYLGNTPGESFISFAKQVFTIVNSQTAYTLDFSVVDENELRLVINNVVQEPGSGKAYTASGTTLTLSAALTNGTDEMYCVFLGKARETVTVPTITKDKLNLISTSSSAGLEVKGDGTTDGTLQLNCSQNSHGIKLASPPHSAGQSYTLTFPQSISADTFLKTDGSGNLSFASAGGITMADNFRVTSNFTGDANPISSNWERNDTAPALASFGSQMSESSGIFTFPSTGIYYVGYQAQFSLAGDSAYVNAIIQATTNNSSYSTSVDSSGHITQNSSATTYAFLHVTQLFDITDTSNQKVRFRIAVGNSGTTIHGSSTYDQTAVRFFRLGDT